MVALSLLLACSPTVAEPAPAEPVAAKAPDEPRPRPFESSVEAIGEDLQANMQGVSMHPGCPVGFDELRLVTVQHHDYQGAVQTGQIIVGAPHAQAVAGVFEALFREGFAIERMRPVHEYGGSDDRSMAANNTSAFNCRAVTGGGQFSQHSYGNAIDLNPLTNPYVKGSLVLPPGGKAFVDREQQVPGLVRAGDAAVTAFAEIGWKWGGDWTGAKKDYQHFSSNGR